jgi:hypothetical protein
MMGLSIPLQICFMGIYFLATFGLGICQDTLFSMCCISSLPALNLMHATIGWIILVLLKTSYHQPLPQPPATRTRILAAALQIAHGLILSGSAIVNPFSVHRFGILLSVPYCFIFYYCVQGRVFPIALLLSLVAICTGCCLISTDDFSFSLEGFYLAVLDAVINVSYSLYLESVMHPSVCPPVLFQESIAGYRLVISVFGAAVAAMASPSKLASLQFDVFVLCLLVSSAALDLVAAVARNYVIASSNALVFLVFEQSAELTLIFIGHTLNPTRFTTIKEELLTFCGFSLAVSGQILFAVIGSPALKRSSDEVPFQPVSSRPDLPACDIPDEELR